MSGVVRRWALCLGLLAELWNLLKVELRSRFWLKSAIAVHLPMSKISHNCYMAAIDRGKEIIKEAIRSTQSGFVARIPVEDQANLAVFHQALRSADIQRMLVQKNVSVEFYMPESPIEQAKKMMLKFINEAPADIREIVFPYRSRDCDDAQAALESPEVQGGLTRRGITASIQRIDDKPSIVIASIDQVISGELDRYMREQE